MSAREQIRWEPTGIGHSLESDEGVLTVVPSANGWGVQFNPKSWRTPTTSEVAYDDTPFSARGLRSARAAQEAGKKFVSRWIRAGRQPPAIDEREIERQRSLALSRWQRDSDDYSTTGRNEFVAQWNPPKMTAPRRRATPRSPVRRVPREPKLLRDMEHPTVLGYELDRKTLTPIRRSLPPITREEVERRVRESSRFDKK